MKDVLVDQDGEFRCPECHGRNFDRKRTLKAKASLGVVVLPAALLAPKRLKCMGCGTYCKTGSAKAYRDPQTEAPRPATRVKPPTDTRAPGHDFAYLTIPEGAPTVTIRATGTRHTAAVTAGMMLKVLPTLPVERRLNAASNLGRGQTVDVVVVSAEHGERVAQLLRDIGVDAEVV